MFWKIIYKYCFVNNVLRESLVNYQKYFKRLIYILNFIVYNSWKKISFLLPEDVKSMTITYI